MTRNYAAVLERFRSNHQPLTVSSGGHDWRYFASGAGEPVVLLEGGLGNGESYFEYVLALEDRFHVIAPAIPASVRKLDVALDGLAVILNAGGLSAAHFFGHSQGGFVALAFASKYPARVKSLILSSTALPQPDRAARIEKQARLVKLLPGWLLRTILVRQLRKVTRANAPELSDADTAFWAAFMAEPTTGLKGRASSSASIQVDYHRHGNSRPTYSGPILLLHCECDTLVPRHLFDDLHAALPCAQTHVLQGTGHLGMISRSDEYRELIEAFIDGTNKSQNACL